MRLKEKYSLSLDELINEVPSSENLPTKIDSRSFDVGAVCRQYENSLNLGKAFGNYLIERNRTKDMAREFAAKEAALDARNYEAEKQSKIIEKNYAVRLQQFLEYSRQELDLENKKLFEKSEVIAEQVKNARETEQEKISILTEVLSLYHKYIVEMQEFLHELENRLIVPKALYFLYF